MLRIKTRQGTDKEQANNIKTCSKTEHNKSYYRIDILIINGLALKNQV